LAARSNPAGTCIVARAAVGRQFPFLAVTFEVDGDRDMRTGADIQRDVDGDDASNRPVDGVVCPPLQWVILGDLRVDLAGAPADLVSRGENRPTDLAIERTFENGELPRREAPIDRVGKDHLGRTVDLHGADDRCHVSPDPSRPGSRRATSTGPSRRGAKPGGCLVADPVVSGSLPHSYSADLKAGVGSGNREDGRACDRAASPIRASQRGGPCL
jgi:hypothetical protein